MSPMTVYKRKSVASGSKQATRAAPSESTVTGHVVSYDRMTGRGMVSSNSVDDEQDISIDVGKLELLDGRLVSLSPGQKVELHLKDDAPYALKTQSDS